jgi:CO dehydrogenase maturation factor
MTNPTTGTLASKKIGVFGKGGCGKSTVSILLARALRSLGYEVVLLDADSTNVGLPAVLGVERPPEPLLDHFGGMVFSGGAVTCPVDDPTPLAAADISLSQLPPAFVARTSDGIYLLVAGKIGEQGPGAGCDGPVSKIARDLRVHAQGKDPVTVVDFKAGFEDSARGVVTGLDWALVVVDPTLAAVQMAADLKQTIERIRAGALPATRHLHSTELISLAEGQYRNARIKGTLCVLSKIPDDETEGFLRAKLMKKAINPVGVIHVYPSVAVAWLRGVPLDDMAAGQEARDVLAKVESADARSRKPERVL